MWIRFTKLLNTNHIHHHITAITQSQSNQNHPTPRQLMTPADTEEQQWIEYATHIATCHIQHTQVQNKIINSGITYISFVRKLKAGNDYKKILLQAKNTLLKHQQPHLLTCTHYISQLQNINKPQTLSTRPPGEITNATTGFATTVMDEIYRSLHHLILHLPMTILPIFPRYAPLIHTVKHKTIR